MTQEERKVLEDAAAAARTKADEAHEAAANAPEDDADALSAAADTAEAEAQTAQEALDTAVVDAAESEEEEDGKGEEDETDIDFEKELASIENGGRPPAHTPAEQPKTELEKAKRALHFNAKRLKELGGDPAEVIGTPAPVVPPVVPPADNSTLENLAEMEAAKYARTDAERKVIMHKYRNAILRSGNIVEDVQNAYMLAHKGRITRSFDEIRRGAAVRPMRATPPGRRAPAASQKAPELSVADQKIMKQRGFEKQADGSYESKGYVMKYDATKKGFVTTKKQKRTK